MENVKLYDCEHCGKKRLKGFIALQNHLECKHDYPTPKQRKEQKKLSLIRKFSEENIPELVALIELDVAKKKQQIGALR